MTDRLGIKVPGDLFFIRVYMTAWAHREGDGFLMLTVNT